jgi:hypothetical protein
MINPPKAEEFSNTLNALSKKTPHAFRPTAPKPHKSRGSRIPTQRVFKNALVMSLVSIQPVNGLVNKFGGELSAPKVAELSKKMRLGNDRIADVWQMKKTRLALKTSRKLSSAKSASDLTGRVIFSPRWP